MRENGPITSREILLEEGDLLVSKTDTGGRITFVNHAFEKVSGFSRSELIGAPHNLVRHPHMPQEAFADLWATVKAGRPWEGLVKNRTKAGDFYWVRANVTPITEGGRVVGYVSIRSKPSRPQVEEAERLYAALRGVGARGLRITAGCIEETGVIPRLRGLAKSVSGRLSLLLALLVALSVAAGAAGLAGDTAACLAAMGCTAVLALAMGLSVLRAVHAPLARLQVHFDAIARTDFSHEIENPAVPDFRRVTALLRAMKAKLGYAALEKAELDRQMAESRRADLERVAQGLEERVRKVVGRIGASSEMLVGASRSLSDNAGETIRQSASVGTLAGQVTGNVQAVSAAGTQLTASIGEIARQVTAAADIARGAVRQAEETDTIMRGLSQAAGRVGQVVKLISDIASQTNLLALNATIESARAGEAGKGFAVVAHEVKTLANQTARATEDITAQIAAIQDETKNAVQAIAAIAGTIGQIHQLSAGIAAAVEQQRAATGEIARAAEHAAQGTASALNSVQVVSDAAQGTGGMAENVSQAAQSLKEEAAALDHEVSAFLQDLRTA